MSEVICEVVTLVKNLLWGGGAGKWRPMGWIIDYFKPTQHQHIADHWECAFYLGMPSFQKSGFFLKIFQKAFAPPPFYLNICPILRGVFFKRVFEH